MHTLCICRCRCCCCCCSVCCYNCCFSFRYLDTVCGFTTEYLDLIDYNYTVRCCTMYEYVFAYTCHVLLLLLCSSVLLYCLWCSCCCLLLLFVIMCRMAKFVAGPLNLMPVYSFSSFKRDLLLMYPLAVLCRFYGLDLPTSSVLMDMRGAKAGVSPPRRSPPCIS